MRYLLVTCILCLGCGTAPNEPDSSVFSDGDVQDMAVIQDQDFLDRGVGDATVPIDMGRGTAGLGQPCIVELDCNQAFLYCKSTGTCQPRGNGASCDRYVTGNMSTERLCARNDGGGLVRPLDDNNIPVYWSWCIDQTALNCGEQSCGFRCRSATDIDGNISVPSCVTDNDCAGHFENPDCYFNTCRTLNCPTPLETTGCQPGEICNGFNLCVPNP